MGSTATQVDLNRLDFRRAEPRPETRSRHGGEISTLISALCVEPASASSEQSLQLAFGAWWRHCNVSKARHSRRSSAAERAVLKSLRGILSESFTEWKDLTRSERLHVLGGQLARAKGNVKALSALKLKTVLQQESGCMCRILMCWQLWTSEQLAIQKERRRLARTAGLGRSSARNAQKGPAGGGRPSSALPGALPGWCRWSAR
eukprot:g4526.t2